MTNVWIIDDEESIRTICTSALEDLFNVESFSSASEALLALNSTKPDLIITDIKMPGMSGLEFLDKVSEKFPNLPTIIITAHANIDNAIESVNRQIRKIIKNKGVFLNNESIKKYYELFCRIISKIRHMKFRNIQNSYNEMI